MFHTFGDTIILAVEQCVPMITVADPLALLNQTLGIFRSTEPTVNGIAILFVVVQGLQHEHVLCLVIVAAFPQFIIRKQVIAAVLSVHHVLGILCGFGVTVFGVETFISGDLCLFESLARGENQHFLTVVELIAGTGLYYHFFAGGHGTGSHRGIHLGQETGCGTLCYMPFLEIGIRILVHHRNGFFKQADDFGIYLCNRTAGLFIRSAFADSHIEHRDVAVCLGEHEVGKSLVEFQFSDGVGFDLFIGSCNLVHIV